jgi:type IV pilus assembly protein PilB
MRRICTQCKEEIGIPTGVLERAGFSPDDIRKRGFKTFYKGKGCSRRGRTGYYGRFGILEALLLDDTVRDMIMKRASGDEIKNYAINKLGMKTLRDSALENCATGVTTLEEALRITSED